MKPMLSTANLPEYQRALRGIRGTMLREGVTQALKAGGNVIRAKSELKCRAVLNKNPMGNLANSIQVQEPVVGRGQAYIDVGTNVEYAAIHEFGGVIKARNAPALVFQTLDGAWHRTKSVHIPARPYMRPALDETRDIESAMVAALEEVQARA